MCYDKDFFSNCYELFSSVCPGNSQVLAKTTINVLLSFDISRMGYLHNRLYERDGFVIHASWGFLVVFLCGFFVSLFEFFCCVCFF